MYEIFEQLMNEKGVTAYRVGKETGIGASTFTDWKNGRSKPKPDKLQKIADYFGVSMDYLMNGKKSDEIVDKKNQLSKYTGTIAAHLDGDDLTEDDVDDILNFIEFVKQRNKKKNDK